MKLIHTGIVVRDMNQSVDFYTRVLGCQVEGQHGDEYIKITALRAGGQSIELLQFHHEKGERGEGVISHIAFAVDDIEKEIQRLKDLGVNLTTDQPREVMGGMKIFFFTGPNGEAVEFVQQSGCPA